MNLDLKSTVSHKKTMIILAISSLILGALCCAFGDILLPLLVASLGALYLFDKDNKRAFSVWVSVAILILNVGGVFLGFIASFFGPAAIILAAILSSGFKKEQSKADTAYLMTLVCSGFTVLSCIFLAMALQRVYTIDAVVAFYTDLVDYIRAIFVKATMEIYTQSDIQMSEEIVLTVFEQQVNSVISYVLIGSFAMVGISMKLFGAIVSRCVEDNKPIRSWRFLTSGLFAYFYVILALAVIFVNPTGVLGVSVLNLYNFLMVVFAYVGFNYALTMLRRRMKRIPSFILLLIITLLFASIAIQLLAFFGVMFTIRKSRENTPIQG